MPVRVSRVAEAGAGRMLRPADGAGSTEFASSTGSTTPTDAPVPTRVSRVAEAGAGRMLRPADGAGSAGSAEPTRFARSTGSTDPSEPAKSTESTTSTASANSTAPTDAPVPVRVSRVAGAGAGLGVVTGVLGVGGGFLAVPSLVNVVGLRMRAAIGTSLLVITINSLTALAARAGAQAPVDWSAVGPFAAAAVLGAWDGKRLAARLSAGTLRRLFACALLAVAVFMLADAVF
ncbi:sulfite exporter TauE/SafE family protein [Streptomyces sp. NPDC004237]|uniref:sulfite exporter TauE/SafE family protein n=1 Tax=Streptomyces sp. NPDC004237 TaxID=3154455 RepID=UPI0033AE3958